MRLYTRTGDKGETGLIGGARVGKDDPRVKTFGEIDELNASIGWAATACEDAGLRRDLQKIQSRLFALGATLADPRPEAATSITAEDISAAEASIDEATAAVAPLTQFILPGGDELAARIHVARAVCRRAERAVVALAREVAVPDDAIAYLNRLADLLFAWGRLANHRAGVVEVPWNPADRL